MPELPTGTVTFLFTDVEGSSRLWEREPDAMGQALAHHDQLIEEHVAGYHGVVVRPRGEGDSRFAVFARASDAVRAAAAIQVALHTQDWLTETPLRVRMALHTGEAGLREGDYYGSAVNRCARLRAIAHGGQTLMSEVTAGLVRQALPQDVRTLDLGEHRLADLAQPERVYQLLYPYVRTDFPPLRSLDVIPNNLPLQLTSFLGRERELVEVERLLTTTRLLTLTGTGGCGKTRLALHVAADQLDYHPDGVWLVELAPLADPVLVPRTVAATVGVREVPGQDVQVTLREGLHRKRLLLVLDNCEHLLAACAQLADALLRTCPSVYILVASREALGVAGEVTWRVPSLATPPLEHVSPVDWLTGYAAVRLFVDRAVAVQPSFAVHERNARAVAEVCTHLDGIPLALELAAARVMALTVEQIAARLSDRFRLLTTGVRTALPRQQTLQATITWSYDLLEQAERVVLQRLSVFAGGWTLEAAEEVCAGDGIAPDDVLDLLGQLVGKSLVLTEEQPTGEERYRLLETIRRFAHERLTETGELELVRSRHRDWCVVLAERAWSALYGPEESAWLDRLATEHDNLRVALERGGTEARDVELALRLAGMLTFVWATRGYLAEGQAQLARVLALDGAVRMPQDWARALWGASLLATFAGQLSMARSQGERALAVRRAIGDRMGVIQSLKDLGMTAHEQHDETAAGDYLEEALALSREAGDAANIATCLDGLGAIARMAGDLTAAHARYAESLAIRQRLGHGWGLAWSYLNLGRVAFDQGAYTKAREFLRESLALSQADANQDRLLSLLDLFATLDAVQGWSTRAVQLAGAAAALRVASGIQSASTSQERLDRALVLARQSLGGEAFTAAWARGQTTTLERAIDVARRDDAGV